MRYRISALTAAAALAAAPAFAGNLDSVTPEAAPQPVPQMSPMTRDWTGYYMGGQLGYGDVEASTGPEGDGLIGGLVAGYDYDFGNWVLGGGLDYDFADIDLGGAATLESVARLKMRGGYKIGDGLAYATAGLARAETDTLGNDNGYFVGLGYEHMITDQFSLGGEALYHEFDDFNGSGVDLDATTVQLRGTFRF
ncbi:porin family protein [Lutimaribacter sp. EGI FJ00015]|uniref:Porin family protein n=1 Tax=Lutimaribacter degradans TaxID=2945989 RepID=A0ACC5ZZ62_9RHOB|nr:outer membrane beta-barrel protein [Lutimaribacter sp. EGI FJ00013]MCM2563644.1 porin family protein [Lutimaribacter sp. EGI FJ00013]MCO0614820.1 porin family protein [Lutimaribacter sp. EGI FJ00015]MCO0637496.1 porin family protein [Lutimaribacter sp. EGI FJ00014]